MQEIIDMPWRAGNEFRRLLVLPYVRAMFALHGVPWREGWRVFGVPMIQRHRGSEILLGNRLSLRSWRSSNPLTPNHPVVFSTRQRGAHIMVGDDCGFTGSVVVAVESVQIGDRVQLGSNVTVTDTDFHPLHPEDRRVDFNAGKHRPVVIEDDVFVGMYSLILKGVTIGRGSVVGAGSVVVSDVPAGMVVAGNPVRILGPVQRI